jgi:hypothetical protein
MSSTTDTYENKRNNILPFHRPEIDLPIFAKDFILFFSIVGDVPDGDVLWEHGSRVVGLLLVVGHRGWRGGHRCTRTVCGNHSTVIIYNFSDDVLLENASRSEKGRSDEESSADGAEYNSSVYTDTRVKMYTPCIHAW